MFISALNDFTRGSMKKFFLSSKSGMAKKLIIVVIVILAVIISAVIIVAVLDNWNHTPPITLEVDLDEAVSGSLVHATVSGDGLEYVDVSLESLSDQPLEVTVPVGTIFEAQSAGLQDMVVIEPMVFDLESRDSVLSRSVSVACATMELDAPGADDVLVISSVPVAADLGALLDLSDFKGETFRGHDLAISTITDNPPRDGYVGIGYFGFGSGPSDEEMSRIGVLFEAAGISTDKYQALN